MPVPALYSDALADIVCERLSNGESLNEICRDPAMPAKITIRKWINNDQNGFATRYARARDAQIEHHMDGLTSLADEVRGCKDAAVVNAARLAIDTRKWIASKLKPKVYGDQVNVTGGLTLEQLVLRSYKAPDAEDGGGTE